MAWLTACAAIHEAGHIVVALCLNMRVKSAHVNEPKGYPAAADVDTEGASAHNLALMYRGGCLATELWSWDEGNGQIKQDRQDVTSRIAEREALGRDDADYGRSIFTGPSHWSGWGEDNHKMVELDPQWPSHKPFDHDMECMSILLRHERQLGSLATGLIKKQSLSEWEITAIWTS
jgi:hypothetical protein